jgi:hypothetical protein
LWWWRITIQFPPHSRVHLRYIRYGVVWFNWTSNNCTLTSIVCACCLLHYAPDILLHISITLIHVCGLFLIRNLLIQGGKKFLSYFQCCIKAWRGAAAVLPVPLFCRSRTLVTCEQSGLGFVKYPKMCSIFVLMITRWTCQAVTCMKNKPVYGVNNGLFVHITIHLFVIDGTMSPYNHWIGWEICTSSVFLFDQGAWFVSIGFCNYDGKIRKEQMTPRTYFFIRAHTYIFIYIKEAVQIYLKVGIRSPNTTHHLYRSFSVRTYARACSSCRMHLRFPRPHRSDASPYLHHLART